MYLATCPACGGSPKLVVYKRNLYTRKGAGYLVKYSQCGYTSFKVGNTADEAKEKWNEYAEGVRN